MSSVKKRRRRQEEEEEEEEEEGARVEGCESNSESSLSGEGEDNEEDDGSSSEFDPSMVCLILLSAVSTVCLNIHDTNQNVW